MAKASKTNKPSAAVMALATTTPTANVPALFTGAGLNFADLGGKRLNAPRMVLPKDMPIGASIIGEVVKISNSPASAVKGKVLWMKKQDGTEFLFPIVGTVRQALSQAGLVAMNGDQIVAEKSNEIVGKILAITRQPDGKTQKAATDEEKAAGGKKMYIMDVFLLDEFPAQN